MTSDQPEAPRLTDSPHQLAEAPVALQQIMALASSRGRLIEALLSDRDQWRQRAETLETALRWVERESTSPSGVGPIATLADIRFEVRQALAASAPQPCPGYVPIGPTCEHCGQRPEQHVHHAS